MSQPTNNSTLDSCIHQIENMIDVAKKYGGYAYGGYVRDVVINRQLDKKVICPKDVDLWFSSKDDAKRFVTKMGRNLERFSDGTSTDYEIAGFGGFTREQYRLMLRNGDTVDVDIIISAMLPVNDYDVNKILYDGLDVSFAGKEKRTAMLPNYVKFLASVDRKILDVHQKRFEKLLSHGWTVLSHHNGDILHKWEDVMSCVAKYQCVMYSVKELDISYNKKFMLAAVVSCIDDLLKQLPAGCEVRGDYLLSAGLCDNISPFDHVDIIMDMDHLTSFKGKVLDALGITAAWCPYHRQYYLKENQSKIALVNIHMVGNVLRSFPMILKPVPSKHMTYHIDDTNYLIEADEATLEICKKYFNKYKAIGWKCTIQDETFDTWEQLNHHILSLKKSKNVQNISDDANISKETLALVKDLTKNMNELHTKMENLRKEVVNLRKQRENP